MVSSIKDIMLAKLEVDCCLKSLLFRKNPPGEFPNLSVFKAVVLLVLQLFVHDPLGSEVDSLVQEGIKAVDKGRHEIALVHYMEAYDKGLSKDSLYFLLAENSFHKGAIDTALAFNLGINPYQKKSELTIPVLEQRFQIYSVLEFNDLAQNVSDTLIHMGLQPQRKKNVSLYAQIETNGGRGRWETKSPVLLPGESNQIESPLHFDNRLTAHIEYAPFTLFPMLETGLKLEVKRKKDTIIVHGNKWSNDFFLGPDFSFFPSSNFYFQGGVYFNWDKTQEEKINYLGFTNFLGVTGIFGKEKFLVNLGWNWDHYEVNSYHLFSTFLNYQIKPRDDLRISPSLYGFLLDFPEFQEQNQFYIYYVDDVTKDNPAHYQSAEFENKVFPDSINFSNIMLKDTTLLKRYRQTQSFESIIRNSFINFRPSVTVEHDVNSRWKAGLEMGYSLQWYLKKYRYIELWQPRDAEAHFHDSALVLNQSDGKLYRWKHLSTDTESNLIKTYSEKPVQKFKRRIDQTFEMEIYSNWTHPVWGSWHLYFNGVISRSNLGRQNALPIPRRDFTIGLNWIRYWNFNI